MTSLTRPEIFPGQVDKDLGGPQKVFGILLKQDMFVGELADSIDLGARWNAKKQQIVKINDPNNKCGFDKVGDKVPDPYGFPYGGELYICSCRSAAGVLARFFVQNIVEPAHSDDFDCPRRSLGCGCNAVSFDSRMDLDYHESHGCLGRFSHDLPPLSERDCNFANVGWCVLDPFVRLLHRTDFAAMCLPPQDLIAVGRRPHLEFKPSRTNNREYKDVANSTKATLLTAAMYVCNNKDINNKKRFLEFLPFFKHLKEWSPELLSKLVVKEIKPNWPLVIKNSVREEKVLKAQEKKRKADEQAAAKEAKKAAKKKARDEEQAALRRLMNQGSN